MRRSGRALLGIVLVVSTIASACAATPIGGTAGELRSPEMGPPTLTITVVASDDLGPLPSASVAVDGREVVLDEEGVATITWPQTTVDIDVAAPGFRSASAELTDYPSSGGIEFRLDPVVLSGRVGTPNGFPLPGVKVRLGGADDVTDDEGRFRIERAGPGELTFTRPAWQPSTTTWDGSDSSVDAVLEPKVVHAIRVGGDAAGNPDSWRSLLGLANLSGIDAFVVDLKDGNGTIMYDTEVARAHEIGAVKVSFDIDRIVADMHDAGLYAIGRIAVFQDPPLAEAEPEHAVIDARSGRAWTTAAGLAWLDPSDPASFDYALDLAEEACRRGFDEIEFDYVSYPFGGDLENAVFDGGYTQEVRVASVLAFLQRASSLLSPMGCATGTTMLGIVLESNTDEGVGQRPGPLSRVADVLSPMLYSTNYGTGWKGFADPNEHAAEIVDGALAAGQRKLDGPGYFRPWIQTWKIGPDGVRAVQQVVDDRGFGWMLWSNASRYDPAALPPR